MRVLIQRVRSASVAVEGREVSRIGAGMLALLGIEVGDTDDDARWIVQKLLKLRVFDDADGMMNLDVGAVGGEIMVVSQFTLLASTRKGNRPSYVRAAGEQVSRPMYERFVGMIEQATGVRPAAGVFGADMQVSLVNDGPVTIWIDSRNRE